MPGPRYRKNAAGFVIFFFGIIFLSLASSCNRSHATDFTGEPNVEQLR